MLKKKPFFSFQVENVLDIHKSACKDANIPRFVQLSLDGVSQAKSNSVTMDVYSIKFQNCRTIYPVKVIRPIEKYSVHYKDSLATIINDLHANNLEISEFIGDNPKRAIVREALNHACLLYTSPSPRDS